MELDSQTPQDPHAPFVDDDEVDGLDLTPRDAPAVGGSSDTHRVRKYAVGGVIALLVLGLGVVAWQGLSNASLYFRNADEAAAQRDSLGDRRFRLQGTVVDSIESTTAEDGTQVVSFVVEHDGVEVQVRHLGDPPELFQPGIPAVLEGRWNESGEWFDSDRVLVKHSETYEEDNPDRTDDYVGEESTNR